MQHFFAIEKYISNSMLTSPALVLKIRLINLLRYSRIIENIIKPTPVQDTENIMMNKTQFLP